MYYENGEALYWQGQVWVNKEGKIVPEESDVEKVAKEARKKQSIVGMRLRALRIVDETAFIQRVSSALREVDSSQGDRAALAAKALGVSRRTLFRWMQCYPQLAEIRTAMAGSRGL